MIDNKKILTKKYKYNFKTYIEMEKFPNGLNKNIILYLSKIKKEPIFILIFRLKAYYKWKKIKIPLWSNLKINKLNFNNIIYYSIPKNMLINNNINYKILNIFKKLGVFFKNKNLKNIAIDLVFNSVSIKTTYIEKLSKIGIIFCSISDAIKYYPNLINKYLGTVISYGDNFFASLNSIIFSDGSFCYIPQNIYCPLELSTYFRINNNNIGQFERTLIIGEKNSYINYIEGCTAYKFNEIQLHAAIVEIIAFKNSIVKYFTIQNWYNGDFNGLGGIYNFVTKRGLTIEEFSNIFWIQIEIGSSITWKYPSCILLGNYSLGEFYSISLTNNYQQTDTGTKMIHIGKYTKSKIISKNISCDFSKNSYRGLVKISLNATNSRNYSQCDSFIFGINSISCTYPYINIYNSNSIIEHEAKISKINEEQLFYFLQRGISIENSINILLKGFCKEILIKLPLDFSFEVNNLLNFKFNKLNI